MISNKENFIGRMPLLYTMSVNKPKILFLTLKTFSFTGGIEKMCRVICRSLYEMEEEDKATGRVYSMYDTNLQRDSRYIPADSFRGYARKRSAFVMASLWQGLKSDVLLLSHVNLLFVALLIRTFHPKIKIYLFAHGIEIWPKLSGWKRYFLKRINVLAVSDFTRNKIIQNQDLAANHIEVLNNGLDPFYELPLNFDKPAYLVDRYELVKGSRLLFTLTRLASSEKYKGYDIVLEILPDIITDFPNLKYLIGGKYDIQEKERVDKLIHKYKLNDHVILPGFIDELELTDHFLLADTFVMPSKKEGFGVVFIEALASGLQVIGGNADGTTDALRDGELGDLVAPEDKEAIKAAIIRQLKQQHSASDKKTLQTSCIKYFSFEIYKEKLSAILERKSSLVH
jgi:phosphatidylinositol alpha-1,6-mannosyltransferase